MTIGGGPTIHRDRGSTVSVFVHSGTFRLSTWHFCSACAECRAGRLMIETQNRAEIHPLLVYVPAGPCAHLLEEPVQTGWRSTFEQAPLSGRRMHCFHHLVGFLFRQQRFRPPQRSGSKAWVSFFFHYSTFHLSTWHFFLGCGNPASNRLVVTGSN